MSNQFKSVISTCLILSFSLLLSFKMQAQESDFKLQNILRVNLVNPGIEYEMPILKRVTLSTNIGVGYGGSYKNTSRTTADGWQVLIAPFLDLELKHLYNIDKRERNNRKVDFNSGNYWGIRCLSRGKALHENFQRYDNFDCAVGPVWGIQRSVGRIHILFDMGVSYYFDSARSGYMPSFQLNIGYDALKL